MRMSPINKTLGIDIISSSHTGFLGLVCSSRSGLVCSSRSSSYWQFYSSTVGVHEFFPTASDCFLFSNPRLFLWTISEKNGYAVMILHWDLITPFNPNWCQVYIRYNFYLPKWTKWMVNKNGCPKTQTLKNTQPTACPWFFQKISIPT